MKSEKLRWIATSTAVSGAICFCIMCFFVEGGKTYANAENMYYGGVISTNVEIIDPPSTLEKLRFDDSVWGRLAAFMQSIFDEWQR